MLDAPKIVPLHSGPSHFAQWNSDAKFVAPQRQSQSPARATNFAIMIHNTEQKYNTQQTKTRSKPTSQMFADVKVHCVHESTSNKCHVMKVGEDE